MDTSQVTRLVVVNYTGTDEAKKGRAIDISDCEVELALQDDGQTLKAFVYNRERT